MLRGLKPRSRSDRARPGSTARDLIPVDQNDDAFSAAMLSLQLLASTFAQPVVWAPWSVSVPDTLITDGVSRTVPTDREDTDE